MSTIEKVFAIESLIQLIFGIVLLVFSVSVYFLNKGKREGIFHNITLFFALFFTIFYTIAGMILFDSSDSAFWQALTSSSGMTKYEIETMYGNIGLRSICWLPCVIEALLFLAYQIIYSLMPDTFSFFGSKVTAVGDRNLTSAPFEERNFSENKPCVDYRNKSAESAVSSGSNAENRFIDMKEDEKINLLLKYKELMDNGVLSQSEFDGIKKKILD